MNIAAYFLMYLDKQKAKNQQWRISERTFFSLSLLGGFMGVHLGMQHFRHKTQHMSFKIVVIMSALIWLIGVPYYLVFMVN
ncbi:DUF1294 domain-containing protein [Conservatibacter flavescens]|uniref:DUF1294 domain-containing protein n=2 Tax=Conservatibacter flavescens TaxID=28161 RepID=A0A2M8S3A9_9PAST|nr:DUF1294 domain-containing protein [Conservatibacter flavescens]